MRHGQNDLRIALGRKNYLFVGDVEAGKSLVGLYSLVATCESRGLNPFDYLADVLARVQDHPASALDDLLPGAWALAGAEPLLPHEIAGVGVDVEQRFRKP